MAYNQLNYLEEVKHTQMLISQLYEESAGFATMAWMWRKLRKEKKFFKGYHAFLRHASEHSLDTRIEALQNMLPRSYQSN